MLRRRAHPRPWCVPPAIRRAPGETVEGAPILEELPSDLGVLLWRTYRDVVLWAEVEPAARAELFTGTGAGRRLARLADTNVPAAAAAPLDTIHGLLRVPDADAAVLAICCLEVAAWARREGLPQTAVAFAQAAALAAPDFGEAALHTGIAAVEAGEDARAETWLRRAVDVARREKDGAAYAAGLVELAGVYERRGDAARAEHVYRRACRAARRLSERGARSRAAHGLFRLACARGDEAAAARFASEAFRACPAQGGSRLLLDVARFWADAGDLPRARSALRRLPRSDPHRSIGDQLLFAALAAHAFAGSDAHLGAAAAADAWRFVADESILPELRSAAAVHLAHAARIAGDRVAFARAQRAVLRLAPPDAPHPIREPRLCGPMAEGLVRAS